MTIKIMIIEYVQSLKRSNGEVEATVDQNISIPIKNLLNFADFWIIKYIVLIPSKTDRPIMASLHWTLMYNHAYQTIIRPTKTLNLIIGNWIPVLHFLAIYCLKAVQVNNQNIRKCFNWHLFES